MIILVNKSDSLVDKVIPDIMDVRARGPALQAHYAQFHIITFDDRGSANDESQLIPVGISKGWVCTDPVARTFAKTQAILDQEADDAAEQSRLLQVRNIIPALREIAAGTSALTNAQMIRVLAQCMSFLVAAELKRRRG